MYAMGCFDIVDADFRRFVIPNAPVRKLAEGFAWAEGPVWFGDMGCLLFSDIPNDRVMRWTEAGLSVFRAPAHFANGHTRDRAGRLISCQHGSRSVTRTELDGRVTVLADRFDGKPLNSPNDVVVHADGSIWFSDPHYGIMTDYEGARAVPELPCCVYRLDPSGRLEAVLTDFACPNGLAFSPDWQRLYVADTGRMFSDDPQHIRVFDMASGRPRGGEIFHKVSSGCTDGLRTDCEGFVWSSAGDGVHCIAPDGRLMGRILVPEVVTNLCFGGRARDRLFMTGATALWSVVLNRQGAQWP
jgi:gluconolactonase